MKKFWTSSSARSWMLILSNLPAAVMFQNNIEQLKEQISRVSLLLNQPYCKGSTSCTVTPDKESPLVGWGGAKQLPSASRGFVKRSDHSIALLIRRVCKDHN